MQCDYHTYRPDCTEQISVSDGRQLLARICKNNLKGELDTFTFNLTSSEVRSLVSKMYRIFVSVLHVFINIILQKRNLFLYR